MRVIHPEPQMIPVGYMAKRIAPCPDWIKAAHVVDICAVSRCISADFVDYTPFWRHNGWWLFNSVDVIRALAAQENIELSGVRFFYYEAFEREYVGRENVWRVIKPEASFVTQVLVPQQRELLGFDVVSFSSGTSPECSPLSCNGLAGTLPVNSHCLFDRFGTACDQLEAGNFAQGEPGPHRIFAVYAV